MAIGQAPPFDPTQAQQAGMMNPMMPPPGPPQTTPPVFGFQVWAQDPANAHKVQAAMTGPDQPLQPNAPNNNPQPMASVAPPVQQNNMQPPASAAPPTKLATDQAELQRLQTTGAGVNQVKNPWLRGLGKAADIAGTILAPGIAAAIPGTTVHNWQLQKQAGGRVAADTTAQQAAAQLADTQSQTAQRTALGNKADSQADAYAPIQLSAEQAAGIGHPELAGESMPSKTYAAMLTGKQKADAQIQVGAGHDTAHTDAANIRANVASMKPKQRDDQYIQIMSKPPNQRTPEDVAFKQGYEAMINTKTTQPGVARATAFANARPVQVVDPSSNNVVYQTAGNAITSGAATPQSADYAAGKSLQKSFTSGDGAKNLNAFNTASAHLQTLGKAAEALHNGDVQGLNRVGNEWAKQTGSPAPQNFEAVKSAVAGEVSKTFKGGQATDAEIKEFNNAISSASSPAQLRGVISTYQDLMESKRGALQQQYEQGMKGLPNFSGGRNNMQPPTQGGGSFKMTATGPNGHKIGSNDGNSWVDVQTGRAVQ